jgi:hypothetical protein
LLHFDQLTSMKLDDRWFRPAAYYPVKEKASR